MTSLFEQANHMLVVYCVLYAVGNMTRAFFFKSDTSPNAVGVSVVFWLLSIWLLVNSIIYYKAFLLEMEAATVAEMQGTRQRHMTMEGTGVLMVEKEGRKEAKAEPAQLQVKEVLGGAFGPSDSGMALRTSARSWRQEWSQWVFYLKTEVGWAYFLNIVGSFGYFVSSLISLFLTVAPPSGARDVDRASLCLDIFNMMVFVVDGFLFAHVWWKETEARSLAAKMRSVYLYANLANVVSSVAYCGMVAWALAQRYFLASQEPTHAKVGEDPHATSWYDEQLVAVSFRQRSMYFGADLLYLLYAILLEVAWRNERAQVMALEQEMAEQMEASASQVQMEHVHLPPLAVLEQVQMSKLAQLQLGKRTTPRCTPAELELHNIT